MKEFATSPECVRRYYFPYRYCCCPSLHLLAQAFDTVPSTPVPEVKEDIQCEFCEKVTSSSWHSSLTVLCQVIKHWVDTYASNASLAEFKQLMDGICEKVAGRNYLG